MARNHQRSSIYVSHYVSRRLPRYCLAEAARVTIFHISGGSMTVSRRGFLHTLTTGTMAGSLGMWSGRALANTTDQARPERDHDGFLLLNSNENAYGPSTKVIAAAQDSLG